MCVRDYVIFVYIFIWSSCFHSAESFNCSATYSNKGAKIPSTGAFRSPSFEDLVKHKDMTCTYVFQGNINDRVKITFDTFSLVNDTTKGCNLMYVDVIQIDLRGMMDLDRRLCGTDLPEVIISVYQLVHLVFNMRPQAAHKDFKGFTGRYEFLDELWQPFNTSSDCGEIIRTGVGGEITSPNYPLPYKTNIECTWMIKVKIYQTIVVRYLDMDLGESFHCSTSNKPYIAIWNGFASPDKKQNELKCGQQYYFDPAKMEFSSSTFRVVIRFETGSVNLKKFKGFRLVWTAITIPKTAMGDYDASQCSTYMCEGGEACIAKGVICNPRPRYCIDESLVCNGVNNCAMGDESDESGCWISIIVSVSTIGGVLLIAVCIGFMKHCCKRRRQRRQLRRGGHDAVHYDPNDKLQGEYLKERCSLNGRKISVSYSPVRKLSSPGYIAIYSPDKKGYSVYDEYDSDTCWNHKDKARIPGETYVNHNAQHYHQHHQQQAQSNHYENRESLARERLRSPTSQHSPRNRLRNSPSGPLVHIRKSQYISCPTLPTPPESDPEVDSAYATQTYIVGRDRVAMTHQNPTYCNTVARVNSQSKSAVV